MRSFIAGVVVGACAVIAAVWPPTDMPVPGHVAAAIRSGCSTVMIYHRGITIPALCTYDGCYDKPNVTAVGPASYRTLSSYVTDNTLPAYVIIEHRVGQTTVLHNVTGTRAVQCFVDTFNITVPP